MLGGYCEHSMGTRQAVMHWSDHDHCIAFFQIWPWSTWRTREITLVDVGSHEGRLEVTGTCACGQGFAKQDDA